jgi:hypothetical protein
MTKITSADLCFFITLLLSHPEIRLARKMWRCAAPPQTSQPWIWRGCVETRQAIIQWISGFVEIRIKMDALQCKYMPLRAAILCAGAN